MTAPKHNWWKASTCYQIWPASYKDSNGDGIGDIPGIIGTLPYLQDLGIETIWLSPMYDSPQADMGYDISNYEDVHHSFGTLADMDQLIRECHSRDMKLILDLVINHTSNLHSWFLQSRKDKTNQYADWYVWRDPKIGIDGKRNPPNNWRAVFGGSAWEYCQERDQYYLHIFLPEQPDLNWENDEARQGIYKSAIEFWLNRGIDGFRVDAANLYSKNIAFPDALVKLPGEEYQPAFEHIMNGPRMHDHLKEIRQTVLDKYGDIFMVGELPFTPKDELLKYVSAEAREYSCIFDFAVVNLGTSLGHGGKRYQTVPFSLPQFKDAIRVSQDLIRGTDAWSTVFLENHDQGRSLTRFATDKPAYRDQAAKLLATLLCCLSGTLFIYQGQEIGMYNHSKDWSVEDLRDVDSISAYNEVMNRHGGDELWGKKALDGLQLVGRDNARTPVQWDATAHAGFTSGDKPWMRVHDDYETVNVAAQLGVTHSPLEFWKRMIRLRKQYDKLMIFAETFEIWDTFEQDVFTFTKTHDGNEKLLVFLNFSDNTQPMEYPPGFEANKELLISNVDEVGKYLTPWEARVYLIPGTVADNTE